MSSARAISSKTNVRGRRSNRPTTRKKTAKASATSPISGRSNAISAARLREIGVVVRVRGRTAAEKAKRGGRRDLVPCAGRNQNRVARRHRASFPIDFHSSLALQQEI